MNEREIDVLFHAMGYGPHGQVRERGRNHYVAGGDDEVACRALAERGLMRFFRQDALTGGDPAFIVTTQGQQVVDDLAAEISDLVAANTPKMTRSQERYDRYLRQDPDLSFGEWLKRGFDRPKPRDPFADHDYSLDY